MSTRSTTHFGREGETSAIVYRHSDGYPEGAGTDIYRFLQEVKDNVGDTRFSDPSYLAAKYVVWLAKEFAKTFVQQPNGKYDYEPSHYLDFLSVGVVMEDPGDIEYRYRVHCDKQDDGGLPVVVCNKVLWEPRGKDGEEHTIPRPEAQAVA